MTHDEVKQCVFVMNSAYPNMKYNQEQLKGFITAWEMMLGEYDFQLVASALKAYIATDTSGFPPAIGQIMEQIRNITSAAKDDSGVAESEAWAMVRRAISRGTYNSAEEYAKFPEEVKKAVGDARQLYFWAVDENFNESVVQSQFLKSYRTEVKRKEEYDRLPIEIKNLIGELKVNGNNKKGLVSEHGESADRIAIPEQSGCVGGN